ncbi:TPA: hypothetical protein ACJ3HJ_001087 [Neisseria meningitidis]|uniref:hypothetical protein n=1 Tax=Neisseria TaxID=482 RepID=UPI0002DF20DB|nr:MULTISPECIES: hypothetical protein [Neisseria]
MPSENGRQVIRGKSAALPLQFLNYTSRHLPAENGFHIQHPFLTTRHYKITYCFKNI